MSQLALFDIPISQRSRPSLSGYSAAPSPRCEYLVAISLPPIIFDAVDRTKEELDHLLGGGNKWRWSKPHISLAIVKAARADEAVLVDLVRHGCDDHEPFDLHFSGYGHFQDSRTVFLNPVEKAPIEDLAIHLKTMVQLQKGMRPKEVWASLHPHMTIGKGLFGRGHFKLALELLDGRSYSARMLVDRVLLLRRGVNPTTSYERVGEFKLGSNLTETNR